MTYLYPANATQFIGFVNARSTRRLSRRSVRQRQTFLWRSDVAPTGCTLLGVDGPGAVDKLNTDTTTGQPGHRIASFAS